MTQVARRETPFISNDATTHYTYSAYVVKTQQLLYPGFTEQRITRNTRDANPPDMGPCPTPYMGRSVRTKIGLVGGTYLRWVTKPEAYPAGIAKDPSRTLARHARHRHT